MKLTLGISPCPNDTFAFAGIILGKIDLQGLEFNVQYKDVQELNTWVFSNEVDVCKMSFAAFGNVTDLYSLLDSGSALGRGCGPLLITRDDSNNIDLANATVAIPGKDTTANLLLSHYTMGIGEKKEMLFSEIENAVVNGDIDAGVIIHENRFTYMIKPLRLIADLGKFWEDKTGLDIPLGGIVINKRIDNDTAKKVNAVLRASIEYAWANKQEVLPYMKQHSQELEDEVIWQHVNLYVNENSLTLDSQARKAITRLIDVEFEVVNS